jgi:hypothetical protein
VREERKPLFVTGVPRSLVVELDRLAQEHERSRTAEIRWALAEHVRRSNAPQRLAGTAV